MAWTSQQAFDAIAAEVFEKSTAAVSARSTIACGTGACPASATGVPPYPIIYCDDCDAVPVPEDQDLPVVLPEDVEVTGHRFTAEGHTRPSLTWTLPRLRQGRARRETDTFDTFVESSWYFSRYASPDNDDTAMVDDREAYWMPVDQYTGGVEHAILHLLYSRFWQKVMRDFGLSDRVG